MECSSVLLGICQMAVTSDKALNIRKAERMLTEAAHSRCQIAILPEMFNCPYEAPLFSGYSEQFPDGDTLRMLSATAARERIAIVGGSIPERDKHGNLYNTSFIFDNRGQLAGRHRKIHLFDVAIAGGTVFKESSILSPGQDITVVNIADLPLGIGICYDIRFPELSRLMALKGARILIFPGVFGLTTGPAHWELLIRSRAVDNQSFVVGAAPANNPEANYEVYGHSMAVDPWGRTLQMAGADEQLLVIEINLDLINTVRRELPLLQHRRTDIYTLREEKRDDLSL